MTRVPPHISPSQIATSRQCLRRWWFEKVRGLTSPGTAATLFGSTLHAVVEGYLLKMNEQQLADHIKATVPDTTPANVKKAKDLLAVAIPAAVLPPPGTGRVEEEMVIPFPPMPGGLKGRLDFVDLQRAVPLVLDHKTTSDPAYAKTEDTLRADPQVILYSRWALLQRPDADRVDVRYVYYLTKGGNRVWAVDIRLTREEVEASYAWLSDEISKMVSAFGEEDPGRLDFKLSACNSYGRACPAMGQCPAHAKPETPQVQTGADRLRALRTAHASQCNVPTTSAAYAAIPKESSMTLTTGQIKIAFMNFGKILADSGVSADTRAAVQEDVLANPDMIGPVESLPAISDELKKLAPATPANAVGAMTQWILDECRRRERKAKEAEANLAAATAAEPAVFEDVTLSDEQAEYKDMLEELGYPETEAIRMVLRELDRAVDIVANAIRYTGTDEDEDEEVPVAAPPPQRGSPLAGRATTAAPPTAVVSPVPEQPAAPANSAAFADLIAGLSGGGAALAALQRAYANLSGDDLTTVDAWLVGRQNTLGKASLAPFLLAFCSGIDASDLQQTNSNVTGIRDVYLAAATSIKDKARVRDIESQMPAIVRLFGGAQVSNGGYTLPFRSGTAPAAKPAVEAAPAAKPASVKAKAAAETPPAAAPVAAPPPAPAPVDVAAGEATRLDVFIDIALVRGPLPTALPLSDLWMNAVVAATESTGKDPRLDQFGSALKPVALAVTREIARRLSDGSITLIVDSQSQAWKLCGDEITAIADVVLRGY